MFLILCIPAFEYFNVAPAKWDFSADTCQSIDIMIRNTRHMCKPCTYGPDLGCSRILSETFSVFDDNSRSRGRSLYIST